MEHIYAVKSAEALVSYQRFSTQNQDRLSAYIAFLEREYAVRNLPKAIVWTDRDTATRLISSIPIPAYTNDFRVVMTSDIDAWREIYLSQLTSMEDTEEYEALRNYYSRELSENNILQILGHELAHHSALFLDDPDPSVSDGIWFEEGMAEYISRRYFLTESEYKKAYFANAALVRLLNSRYGAHSLEDFGSATYEGDYASIFFEYWRSFLTIHKIVDQFHGDIKAVFASYHRWSKSKPQTTLLDWFGVIV